MDTSTAPDITPGYPSRGRVAGPAWQAAWNALGQAGSEWTDGMALSAAIAVDRELSPLTVRGILFRAAREGLIESRSRMAETPRGMRMRTAFRRVPGEEKVA